MEQQSLNYHLSKKHPIEAKTASVAATIYPDTSAETTATVTDLNHGLCPVEQSKGVGDS